MELPEELILYNMDLERNILGVLMKVQDVPEFLGKYPYLQEGHFYFDVHQKIFKSISDVKEGGASIFKLSQILPDSKDYLIALNGYGILPVFKEYVANLIDLFKRRKLQEVCEEIQESYSNFDVTANESIIKLNGNFENLLKKEYDFDIKGSDKVSKEILYSLDEHYEINSTGIRIIDTAMGGGFYKGKAYAIAARKKTGKTVLASTISNNLNFDGVRHLFVAAEMSPVEIHQRNMARNIGKNSLCFIGDAKKNKEFQQCVANYQDPGNIQYLKAPGIAFNHLRMAISSAILRYGIEGVIIDYFQLIGGKQHRESLASHYDEVAQWIANFCRDNNIWALVMAQMNQDDNIRGGEGIRLAFDQVYELKKCKDSNTDFFMDQMDTRYTPWCDMGDENKAALVLETNGPYFRDSGYFI